MPSYLLIESRDPFDSGDTAFIPDLATRLAAAGNRVTLFLIQNGVLPARAGCHGPGFGELAQAGVEVLADEFSLRERGVGRLQPGIKPTAIDTVVDRLAEGCNVIWH
jgi:DsrE/DsrF/DsrH-like protein